LKHGLLQTSLQSQFASSEGGCAGAMVKAFGVLLLSNYCFNN